MAGRHIKAAKAQQGFPYPTSRKYKTGETFKIGACLVFDANGELVECGADPSTISAIAAEPAGSRPGYDAANSPLVVTGRKQEVSVWDLGEGYIFSMRGVNGGTDPVTPTQTMVDEQYGVAKDADGIWYLDLAETTAVIFEVVDFDADNKIFYCKAIVSKLSLPVG